MNRKNYFRKSNKLLGTYLKKMVKAFGQIQNNKIVGSKSVECVQQSIDNNINFEPAQNENNQLLDIISNNLQSGYYSSYDNMKGLDFTYGYLLQ